MKLRHRWCLVFSCAIPTLIVLALIGAGKSYALWAGAGIAATFLIYGGVVFALTTLVLDIFDSTRASFFWGLLLLAVSGAPILFSIMIWG